MARYFSGRLIGIHLFALAAIFTCLWLGNWQWDRAHRTVQLETISGKTDFASLSPLRDYLPPSSVGIVTQVSGTWQSDGRIIFANRPIDGTQLILENNADFAREQTGFWVLDILNLDSGSSLGVVHSWVSNATDIVTLSGKVTITGVMQPSEFALQNSLIELPSYITTEEIVGRATTTVHDGYFVTSEAILGSQKVNPIFDEPQEAQLQWRNVIYTGNWVIFALIVGAMWWRIIQDEVKQLETSNYQVGQ